MSVQAIAGLILNFTYVKMKGPNKDLSLIFSPANTEGPAWFVMCNMCAMLTEIYTIEGGKKDVSSVKETTIKKIQM